MKQIPRHELRRAMADRAWHSLPELLAHFGPTIPPEDAGEAARTLQRKDLHQLQADYYAALGRRQILLISLNAAAATTPTDPHPLLRRRGPPKKPDLNEYALARWYCYSCGAPQDGEPTPRRLCPDCAAVISLDPTA